MSNYDPSNHYWIVAGNDTKVFSSASGDYVPVDDTIYVDWVNEGGVATKIVSETELGEVLADVRVRPENAAILDGFKDRHANKLTLEIVAKILLFLVNEIRELKGQQPVTAQQFKTFVKGKM